ncbi:MAG: hypothetical protein DMF78_13600 [Acidobacteria bacterium]|nr:MAG: hypothetical protein DMF78_13600 [Acidobacteriota bacterium]
MPPRRLRARCAAPRAAVLRRAPPLGAPRREDDPRRDDEDADRDARARVPAELFDRPPGTGMALTAFLARSAMVPAAVVTTEPTVLAAVPTPEATVPRTVLFSSAICLLALLLLCVACPLSSTLAPRAGRGRGMASFTVARGRIDARGGAHVGCRHGPEARMKDTPAGADGAPRAVREMSEQVAADGGTVLAAFREPVGGHWQLFALLPIDKVAPTPYQRDLSPTHVKRLHDAVKKIGRFVDPIVVVSPQRGVYWTPNGHHRLKVLQKLKADVVPALLILEPEVAFQILALNTEKAHNLKEKSLEVIRMYRGLAESEPRSGEEDYAFQFEAPHLVTLGLLYEQNKRFAGGAFAPLLRRVDGFLSGTFAKTLPVREARAEKVRAADAALADVVAQLKKRGIRHPFVKNYVLARTTPLGRARKTLPSFDQALDKLLANIEAFDVSKVRYDDVQRAGVMAAAPAD